VHLRCWDPIDWPIRKGVSRPELRRDRCGRGHPMAGDNVRTFASGRRVCKACDRIRVKKYQARSDVKARHAANARTRRAAKK